MLNETQRDEYVAINGITGIVGANTAVEYWLTNDDKNLCLRAGNDLSLAGRMGRGELDESAVRDFARYLAEFGNQGRPLLDEPVRTGPGHMAVTRAVESCGAQLRVVVDRYIADDDGRFGIDNGFPQRDEKVDLFAIREPVNIPWTLSHIGHVVDATTSIVTADQIREHVRGGVTQAIKTAPKKGEFDLLWVAGVTDERFDPEKHRTIAEGACTLQCFGAVMAPLFKVPGLQLRKIEFSTIHGVTGDQRLVRGFRPGDMPRGLPGDEDFIRTQSGSAGDLSDLVRYLADRHRMFSEPTSEIDMRALLSRVQLVNATRVPAKDSATLDFRVELNGQFTLEDIKGAYRDFGREHPEVLRVIEDPVAIASSTIRGRRESGTIFLNTLTLEDGMVLRGTAGYAHENNTPSATLRISKEIAKRKRAALR